MTKVVILLFISFLIISCQQEVEPKEQVNEIITDPQILAVDDFNYDTLKGLYSGEFNGNQIRIVISYSSQSNAIGYNIHKGLHRNISGVVNKSEDTVYMILSEPGDHEFDGVFSLTFVGEDNSPSALWICNDPKIKPKQFTLSKIIAPSKNSDKLTHSNFSNYFDLITDTIGTYSFENDGFLLFEYYPKTDEENRVEQLIEIKGNWSLSDEKITINWQENSLFSRKEIFNIMKTDSESYYLENEDRRLHNYY